MEQFRSDQLTLALTREVVVVANHPVLADQPHPVRQKERQGDHPAGGPVHLGKCIAAQQHAGDHCLPELHRAHVLVRGKRQDAVQRMVGISLAAAIRQTAIDPQG
ncbi:hypothetical protein D9M69_582480 [compost metagenome]